MNLLESVRTFLAFGRPKEGSDRSKAAWDKMQAAAAREEPRTLHTTQDRVEAALVDALAWARAYGPVINRQQWDEMRDTKVRQILAGVLEKPESEVVLKHTCRTPEYEVAIAHYTRWECPDCGQAWRWNGTGWYKISSIPTVPPTAPGAQP